MASHDYVVVGAGAGASVPPSIPNANTNATVLAIAERAAELLSAMV